VKITESKLREIIREELLNEMDYQKFIPIQLDNVMVMLNKIRRANALRNTKAVKKYYMDAWKNFQTLKKSIDQL